MNKRGSFIKTPGLELMELPMKSGAFSFSLFDPVNDAAGSGAQTHKNARRDQTAEILEAGNESPQTMVRETMGDEIEETQVTGPRSNQRNRQRVKEWLGALTERQQQRHETEHALHHSIRIKSSGRKKQNKNEAENKIILPGKWNGIRTICFCFPFIPPVPIRLSFSFFLSSHSPSSASCHCRC